MSTLKRIGLGLAAAVISLAFLVYSPTRIEICTEQNLVGRIINFSRIGSSHIDGARASYCYGPSTLSWILFAASLTFCSLAIAAAFGRQRRRQSAREDP